VTDLPEPVSPSQNVPALREVRTAAIAAGAGALAGVATVAAVRAVSGAGARKRPAKRNGRRRLHIRSDSLLLVQQMLGNYKVKNPGLQPLHARARALAREVGDVTFEHVGRSLNAHADRLANTAMDAAEPES